MSLTVVTPPPEERVEYKFTHESSPCPRASSARPYSHLHEQSYSQTHGRTSRDPGMSTHHRGLPPPAAMALPDPRRSSIPPPITSNYSQGSGHGSSQYQSHDEQSRDLQTQARMEEDRKRQEEQKTRQEELRLEQRKIEHNMLRESFQGGVPPHLVPMIFAGIGGGNLATAALDMAQQYLAQFQQLIPQQPTQHDRSRDPNSMVQPPYVPNQHPPAAGAQTPQTAAVYPSPAYNTSPPNRSKGFVPSARQQPAQVSGGNLPKLTTNEAHVAGPLPNYGHPAPQPTNQDITSQSPNIFFHHWQPPSTQSNQSSGKDGKEDKKSTPNSSGNLSSTGDNTSPRKRKAQGPHEPAPVPSSAPKNTSPAPSISSTTSTRRFGGHSKGGSYSSIKGESLPSNLQEESTHSSIEEEREAPKKRTPERYGSAEPTEPPSGSTQG